MKQINKKINKYLGQIKNICQKRMSTLTLILTAILATFLILVIIFCGIYNHVVDLRKDAYGKIIINGQEILLTKDTEEYNFDLCTLNNKYDTTINVELKNASMKINEEYVKDKDEISLGKIDINKENKIKVELKLLGDSTYKEYWINTLPSTFPEYQVEGKKEQTQDYEYYVTTYGESAKVKSYIYNINQKGELTFYKQTSRTPYNFKKNEIDGKIRYTYLEKTEGIYEGINDAVQCKLIVLDEKYNEIDRIGYLVEGEEISSECHDYYYLGDDNYIICAYTKEKVTNVPKLDGQEVNIWNFRMQEIKDGNILWEFQSIKNKQLYENYSVNGIKIGEYKEPINYIHFNSMEIDPLDGNLICSFRNQDAIIKISRTTGEIIWILGGKGDEFGLTEDQKFSKQHSISYLSNHEILIYDNGIKNNRTRILKIGLDEQNKTIQSYQSYDLDIYAPRMGSVEVINESENIYLITSGTGKNEYAFQEQNLETGEYYFKYKITSDNTLYCVNKY